MAKFDNLLNQLHNNLQAPQGTSPVASDSNVHIVIDQNRRFIVPKEFDTTIAYEGDVNSQVVTFECPKNIEGHDLSKCDNKRVRWYNNASGNEGSTVLSVKEIDDILELGWEAPAEAFTAAGNLEISITFSDYVDGRLAFSWNTSTLADLKVGKSLNRVNDVIEGDKTELVKLVPARDEILLVNADTRKIIEPKEYNYTFCNYGDVRTAVVYFQTRRYIRGIDLLDENTRFSVYWKLKTLSNVEHSTDPLIGGKFLYTMELEGRDSEGLVTIVWIPSPSLTQNTLQYTGPIEILLEIAHDDRVWRTASYKKLEIGDCGFSAKNGELPEEESNRSNYFINADHITNDKQNLQISGLTQNRTLQHGKQVSLYKNEIAVEYAGTEFYGLKIGTNDQQSSAKAPYIAYSPDVFVTVDGGDATGGWKEE